MKDDPCKECNVHDMCIADMHSPCEIRKLLEQLREFRNNLPVLECKSCKKTFIAADWIEFKDGHHGPFFLPEDIKYCPFCGSDA